MKQRNTIFSFEDAEESTGFLLWQVTSLWQRQLNALLRKHALTHAQFVVLASAVWLNMKSTAVTQVHIAKHAKMDVMLVSNIIKTLEKKKLIDRALSKTDTRAKIVTVTQDGIVLTKKAVKDVETFDKHFFSKLDTSLHGFNKNLITLSSQNI